MHTPNCGWSTARRISPSSSIVPPQNWPAPAEFSSTSVTPGGDAFERLLERADDRREALRARPRPVRAEVRVDVRDVADAGDLEVVAEQPQRAGHDLRVVRREVDQVRRVDDGRCDPGRRAPLRERPQRFRVDRLRAVGLRIVAEDLHRVAAEPLRVIGGGRIAATDVDVNAEAHACASGGSGTNSRGPRAA